MPSKAVVIGVVVVTALLVTFSAYNYLMITSEGGSSFNFFTFFEDLFNPIISIPGHVLSFFRPICPPPCTLPPPGGTLTTTTISSNEFSYTIEAGDTFYALSSKYCTTESAIEAANPSVNPNDLSTGQVVNMPYGCGGTIFTYTIQSGDTFYALAGTYCTTVSLIELVNPTITPTTLSVGQKVNIPASCGVSTSMTTTQSSESYSYSTLRVTAYICCMTSTNYASAIQYYGTLENHPVDVIAPQIYELSDSGNGAMYEDSNFLTAQYTSMAHSYGMKVTPLLDAGDSFPVGNTGLLALLANPQVLGTQLGAQLASVAKANGYDGWQLDWETSLGTSYRSAMNTAINAIATAMEPLPLSLTTYAYDYVAGPFSIGALVNTNIAQVNVQAYTNTPGTFAYDLGLFTTNVGTQTNKIQVGMGDYSGVNPSIAGYCLQQILADKIQSIAIWPAAGTTISGNGAYGYSDSYYGTTNWYGWFYYYENHVT